MKTPRYFHSATLRKPDACSRAPQAVDIKENADELDQRLKWLGLFHRRKIDCAPPPTALLTYRASHPPRFPPTAPPSTPQLSVT